MEPIKASKEALLIEMITLLKETPIETVLVAKGVAVGLALGSGTKIIKEVS